MNLLKIKKAKYTYLINQETIEVIDHHKDCIGIESRNYYFELIFHSEKQAVKCFLKIDAFLRGIYISWDICEADGLTKITRV